MKKHFRIFLAFGFLFFISHFLKASHGLPLISPSYTIGATGITLSGSSDAATCGGGPFWMQAHVACSPTDFANNVIDPCFKTFLANWTSPATSFNSFPWYNSLLNVPNYNAGASWPDQCLQEPYNNIFIPFSDLCPGEVYYFAFREVVSAGGPPGNYTPVVSFTVPGTPIPKTPGFITSNPVTSPTSPSCGGPVLLTFHPPTGCSPPKSIIPGCATCDSIVWKGPGGTTIAVNTLTVLVTPLVNSTYSVGYQSCSPATKAGCNPPIPTITVYVSNPNATFTSPVTICAGTTVNFTGLTPSAANTWSVSPTTSVTPATSTNTTYGATFDEQGTYVITHQAINGTCTDTKTQTITVTPGITTSITTSGGGCSPASTTGAATVAVTSGTTGVTYTWSPTGGNNESATGLVYNTPYVVTISNGGCTITKTVQIVNVISDGSFTTSSTTICGGSSITFSAIATSTAITDSWSVSPTTSVTPATATTPVYIPVFDEPGTYIVSHTSTNGACTDTQTNTITVNPGIVATTTTSGGGCSGAGTSGSATVAVTSSTTGITYSWTPSGGTSDVENNIPFNTTYSVTISQGGCVITKTVIITNNPPPSVTSFSVTSPTCNGLSNGTIEAALSGGNPPFSFTWTPTITQTTQTVTGVGAGTYSVFVQDNNGCTTNSVVTVTEPPVLTLTASPSSTICSGTSATLTAGAVGGTPVYSYTWNPGNMNGSVPVVVTPTVPSQQYTLSLADANGCTQTLTVSVDVTPVLTATATTYSLCVGDSILLSPTITSAGNGGPYTYTWTGGTTTSTLMAHSGTTAGTATYSVSISDGCTVPGAVTEFTVITNPKPNVSSFSVVTPSCNGQTNGSIAANLTSGTAPFSFTWSPTITQTTQTVTGIGAGTYTVFVSDALGCATQSVITVTQPPVLTLTTSPSTTICFGNSTTLNAGVVGGTPAYSYTWNPGNTHNSSVLVNPAVGTTQYTIMVADINGCSLTQATSVTMKPALTVSATASVLCIGGTALLVPVITSPGNGGPYTYAWSPGGASTPTLLANGTTAGTINYVVTVSDGCTVPSGTASFTVTTNPTPVADITADNLAGNAPLPVNFTDLGTGGNTYNWNFGNGNGSTVQNPSQTYETGGTYQVTYTVTSSSGCPAYDTLSILVIDLIPSIIVPNVFTPNGDRANDLFAVTGINITSFECSIFNRWGKEVFTSSDIRNSWDGRLNGNPADEGTYYYIIKAAGAAGDDIKKQGYVTLFR